MYSKQQVNIMRKLYPDKIISSAKLEHQFGISDYRVMRDLHNSGMIHKTTDFHSDDIYLTETGKAYIEDLDKDKARYTTSLGLSILAILISVAALIVSMFK